MVKFTESVRRFLAADEGKFVFKPVASALGGAAPLIGGSLGAALRVFGGVGSDSGGAPGGGRAPTPAARPPSSTLPSVTPARAPIVPSLAAGAVPALSLPLRTLTPSLPQLLPPTGAPRALPGVLTGPGGVDPLRRRRLGPGRSLTGRN